MYHSRAIPIGKSWVNSFTNKWGLKQIGVYLDVDYSKVEVLQEDKSKAATRDNVNNKTWQQQFANGVITLNEWVVATGGDEKADALYNKTVYEMGDAELEKVDKIVKLFKGSTTSDNQNQNQGNATNN